MAAAGESVHAITKPLKRTADSVRKRARVLKIRLASVPLGRKVKGEMTFTDKWMASIGAASSLGAAGFFWASVIPVPDNLDTFITALQWISRINAIAAICATMAAVCAAYSFVKLSWG